MAKSVNDLQENGCFGKFYIYEPGFTPRPRQLQGYWLKVLTTEKLS